MADLQQAVHGGKFFQAIGEELDDLSRREGVINADVLDAWYPPSPQVIAAVSENLEWLIRTSPPTHAEGLKAVISAARGVPVESIAVAAGSSPLIFELLPRIGGLHRTGIVTPTYSEYGHVLKLRGSEIVEIPAHAPGWRVDVAEIAASADGLDGLVLVNPNSPTGTFLGRKDVEALLGLLPATTPIWIDETYVDYAPGESAETLVADHLNLTVVKSMSKVYALSGVRVGYAVCSPSLAAEWGAASAPWSVGLIGQVAGAEALRDPAYYEARMTETAVLRAELELHLGRLGFSTVPSVANFVFAFLPSGDSRDLCIFLERRGIYIRDCSEMRPDLAGRAVRIAVKPHPDLGLMATAIEEWVTKENRGRP